MFDRVYMGICGKYMNLYVQAKFINAFILCDWFKFVVVHNKEYCISLKVGAISLWLQNKSWNIAKKWTKQTKKQMPVKKKNFDNFWIVYFRL